MRVESAWAILLHCHWRKWKSLRNPLLHVEFREHKLKDAELIYKTMDWQNNAKRLTCKSCWFRWGPRRHQFWQYVYR